MRRHAKQRFMGKAFVYPGGQLDELDCNPSLALYANGITADIAKRRLREKNLSGEKALGLFFAAIRETFEESGVLMGGRTSGRDIDFKDAAVSRQFAEYRAMIHQQKMSLEDLAKEEKLVFWLDRLMPFAHWVTPEAEPKRFDTRFFLAPIPHGQAPAHDALEMTETMWLTPKEALNKQTAGEVLLMPPTIKTIEEMSVFSSLGDLLGYAASRSIPTILPQITTEGDRVVVKLPNDPEYTIAGSKQRLRPNEISRIVIVEGRLKAVCFWEQTGC